VTKYSRQFLIDRAIKTNLVDKLRLRSASEYFQT
jgi:hypothetical protein